MLLDDFGTMPAAMTEIVKNGLLDGPVLSCNDLPRWCIFTCRMNRQQPHTVLAILINCPVEMNIYCLLI